MFHYAAFYQFSWNTEEFICCILSIFMEYKKSLDVLGRLLDPGGGK